VTIRVAAGNYSFERPVLIDNGFEGITALDFYLESPTIRRISIVSTEGPFETIFNCASNDFTAITAKPSSSGPLKLTLDLSFVGLTFAGCGSVFNFAGQSLTLTQSIFRGFIYRIFGLYSMQANLFAKYPFQENILAVYASYSYNLVIDVCSFEGMRLSQL